MYFYVCRFAYIDPSDGKEEEYSGIVIGRNIIEALNNAIETFEIEEEVRLNSMEIHRLAPDENGLLISPGILKTLEDDILW